MATTETTEIIGRATPWFHRRWLIGIAATLGFAVWFAYDGAIGYPKQNEIASEFAKYRQEKREGEWDSYARQRGWPNAQNVPKLRSPGAIRAQLYLAGISGVIGVIVGILYLNRRGGVLKVDASNLYTPDGRTVPLDTVQSVDRTAWADKGIARVQYRVDGVVWHAVVDGMSYGGFAGEKPSCADQILNRVVAHVPKPEAAAGPPPSATPGGGAVRG